MSMSIESSIYSDHYLMTQLMSNSREVSYEYTLMDTSGKLIGKLEIEDGAISYDSDADVMRTFTGRTRKSNLIGIDKTDYYLVPWMVLKLSIMDTVKWPLGKFLIDPSEEGKNHVSYVEITGYDLGRIAKDDRTDARIYAPAGSVYTSLASQVIGQDYHTLNVEVSSKTYMFDMEWEIGESRLDVANDMLKAISYNPIHFDAEGVPQLVHYVEPEHRAIERIYRADELSIVTDGIRKASNKFEIPNKFVRYVENADAPYMIASYINADANSPYSTVSRGRTIVDSDSVENIATQADLDALVRKVACEKMQAAETLTFTTLNMPGHGYRNCLFVDVPVYGIHDKYIEKSWSMELKTGGLMEHNCEKVVTL